MTTELVGLKPGHQDQVQHEINVDAEALMVRTVADDMFSEGKGFSPMMIFFRKGVKVAAVVCRPFDNDKDKDVAFTEMGMLIPCFKADEVVFGFEAYLVKPGGDVKRGHNAIVVVAANKIGMTMRNFPFFTDEEGNFSQWTEDGSDVPNYDPFVSTMLGGYIAYQKRPYMLSALIKTMNRRGHALEVFIDDLEGLATPANT